MKYEYIEKEFYPCNFHPITENLNYYSKEGYEVVSMTPIMFITEPNRINKWIVFFKKQYNYDT